MWVPIRIYKNSISASIISIAGTICMAASPTGRNDGSWVALLIIGISLFVAGGFVAKQSANQKSNRIKEKIYSNPELINAVSNSSKAALELYMRIPNEDTCRFIEKFNPRAGSVVRDMANGRIGPQKAMEQIQNPDKMPIGAYGQITQQGYSKKSQYPSFGEEQGHNY